MTSQVIGSERQSRERMGVNKAGFALALFLGGFHLMWATIVASGLGQPLIDFIFWLHFVRPVYVIEAFDPLRAIELVLVTATIGYAMGSALALLWNRAHRRQG